MKVKKKKRGSRVIEKRVHEVSPQFFAGAILAAPRKMSGGRRLYVRVERVFRAVSIPYALVHECSKSGAKVRGKGSQGTDRSLPFRVNLAGSTYTGVDDD